MRSLVAMTVCGLLAFAVIAADEKKDVVREIDLKGVKLSPVRGPLKEAQVIESLEDLEKVVGEGASKGIKIDFKAEKLAFFQWSGSGQDKMTYATETKDGKAVVTFTLMPGRTRDLRPHAHLYAIPADAEIKVGK